MNCPSCGAGLEVDNRFARLVVCAYCNSSIVLDEKAARLTGKMAVLDPTPSPFFVGATGAFKNQRFTVLGRARYGYAKGFWDEWYLGFENGKKMWIGEDEGKYTLEKARQLRKPPASFEDVKPGDRVKIAGKRFLVEEKDVAELEGAEGQLPFEIVQGETVPFLDLRLGKQFATMEYEEEGVRLFLGRGLRSGEIELDRTAQEAGASSAVADERKASGKKRERVVRSEDRTQGLKCYACAAPLEIPDPDAEQMTCSYCGADLDLTLRRVECASCGATVPVRGGEEACSVVCAHCGSQLDITEGEPSLLGSLADARRPRVPFAVGQTCVLKGETYAVAGHIRTKEKDYEGTYISDEFLLHSKKAGYCWLIMEKGHFSLAEELEEKAPAFQARRARPKSRFRALGRKWTVFETCRDNVEIIWVDGELPWVARVGDRNSYADCISPPYMLSAEWTSSEIEWFRAAYLPREQVAKAFGIPETKLPHARGVAPNQPADVSPFRRQAVWVMGAFALVFLALSGYAWLQQGKRVASFTVSPEAYALETLTPPFEIGSGGAVCEARFTANVNNAWVYLDGAVVNDREEVVLDFSTQMSYYHGTSGGESWSEGSQSDTVLFKLKEAGTYRFLLVGQAGHGEKPEALEKAGKPVAIEVREGAVLVRYYLAGAILCLIAAGVEVFRRFLFEKKRWGESLFETDD